MARSGARTAARPGFVAALIALACLSAVACTERASPASDLVRLFGERPTAGRLSVSPARPDCVAPSSRPIGTGCVPEASEEPDVGRIARLTARLRARASERPAADDLHALALADLLLPADPLRASDRAIASLERALRISPGRPDLWNDLDVSWTTRYDSSRDPRDLVHGLEALHAGLELDPGYAAALYNRALTLDRVGLTRMAAQARRRYLAADSASAWAEAIREADRAIAAELVEPDSGPVPTPRFERLADELLPAWAEARLRGDDQVAERALSEAHALAEALAEAGDPAVPGLVSAVATARGTKREALAEGLRLHGMGRRLFDSARYVDAYEPLATAARLLRRWEPPLAAWPAAWASAAQVYQRQYAAADATFTDIAGDPGRAGSLFNVAQGFFGLGVSHVRRGRYQTAINRYERAEEIYRRLGRPDRVAGTRHLTGEARYLLGQERLALERLLESLRLIPPGPSGTRHNVLLVAGQMLSARYPRAAPDFVEEALAHAPDAPVQPRVEALIWLARAETRAGRPESSARRLEAVRPAVDSVADPDMRDRLRAEYDETLGLLESATTPVRLGALGRAIDHYAAGTLHAKLIPALQARGDLLLETGAVDGAEADLRRVVRLLEEEQGSLREAADRASLVEASTRTYDALMALEVDRGRPENAFRLLDRSHSTVWSAATGAREPAPEPRSDAEAVKDGTAALLAYAVLDERLFVWLESPRGLRFEQVEIARPALRALIDEFATTLRAGSEPGRLAELAARLHEVLIAPVEPALTDVEELLIIPDRELHAVPFAALRAGSSGPHLIERFPLRFVPSGEFRRRRPGPPPGSTALVVSNPEFDEAEHPDLSPIPSASEEASAVAGLWSRSAVLDGASATPAAVRSRLGRSAVFHLAGHARYRSDRPELSHLVLAAPAEADSSDVMHARDIAEMSLAGLRLSVLSACSTLTPETGRTGGLSGLARAFLSAGAGGVVGSLWSVEDRSTADFMASFHEFLAPGRHPADALRAVQVAWIEAGDPARPAATWAAFRYEGW